MKILVCIKQVAVIPGAVVLQDENRSLDPLFCNRRLNDPDRYALEEALRLCEAAGEGEVIVASVGEQAATEALRKCLAMGAHRATRVWGDGLQLLDPLTVARSLAQLARDEAADLVLCGVQSEDAAQQATGPALASALDAPCVTMATGIEGVDGGRALRVQREARGGHTEVVEVDLPAVLTVQTGFNTPRTENFKATMMAKRAQVPVFEPTDLPPSPVRVERLAEHTRSRGQLEWVEGDAGAVAARIRELVREAS